MHANRTWSESPAPKSEKKPASHVQEARSGVGEELGGQSTHSSWCSHNAYCPCGQISLSSGRGHMWPRGHGTGAVQPWSQNVPSGHGSSAVELGQKEPSRPSGLKGVLSEQRPGLVASSRVSGQYSPGSSHGSIDVGSLQ